MNILEFIVAVLVIIVIGIWGMLYLAYKYGDLSYKDENTTVKSKKSK